MKHYYAIHIGPDWFPFGYLSPTQAKGIQIELGQIELIGFDNLNEYLEAIQ
jgi:hypothetical protein